MKKNVMSVLIASVLVLCSIVCVSFVYARVTKKLVISGYASMNNAGKWEVKFANLKSAEIIGTTEEIIKPTIQNSSTSIGNFNIKFYSPLDSISYQFDIVNDGTIDAIVDAISIAKPICNSISNNHDEESMVCNNLEYTLSYLDNSEVKTGDVLRKGESQPVILKLKYNGNDIPIDIVNISNLEVAIIYGQL